MSYLQLKRCLDVIGAIVLLILTLPLMLLGVLLVATTGRPIIFRQQRAGKGGQPFAIYKLRTMRSAPFAPCRSQFDARITKAGRWLRRLRIDELPQLVNVLRGDMSLVGPRPIPAELYQQQMSRHDIWQREQVRPGITGLGKVHDPHGRTIDLIPWDLAYIEQISLWLDARILVLTPLAVARGFSQPSQAEVNTATALADEALT